MLRPCLSSIVFICGWHPWMASTDGRFHPWRTSTDDISIHGWYFSIYGWHPWMTLLYPWMTSTDDTFIDVIFSCQGFGKSCLYHALNEFVSNSFLALYFIDLNPIGPNIYFKHFENLRFLEKLKTKILFDFSRQCQQLQL